MNATVLDQIKAPYSHLEVFTLNKDGSGFSLHALVGAEAQGEQEWIWNAPTARFSLGGSWMIASASLIGPNTIQILNLAGADQITEIQTLRFTAAGIEVLFRKHNSVLNASFILQKIYVASKAGEGTGKTVVWNSFDSRVDQLGEEISTPFRHVPSSYPLVFMMG